jgi:hypothetical protein
MRTARNINRLLAILVLSAPAIPAKAQGDFAHGVYVAIEINIRREYDIMLQALARRTADEPMEKAEKTRTLLKILAYNKAVMFALCAGEADKAHPSGAARPPAEKDPVLTSCVEAKFADLDKFARTVDYVGLFFPDRIAPCGEKTRLADLERQFKPYAFLHLDEARLYDFAKYNRCLMPAP